ncbi:hypothetical protein Bbelb_349860 [Branchiostoma belcheri]|nr:hypothetical protein Bbelb_349860 [Branchiostoma belcheri]
MSYKKVRKTFPHIGWDAVRTHLRQTLKVRREGVRRRQRRASAADSNAAAAATPPPPVRMMMGDVELGTGGGGGAGADKCGETRVRFRVVPGTCLNMRPDVVPLGKALYTTFLTPPTCEWVPNFEAGKRHPAFADKEIPGEVTIDTRVFNIAIAID